MGKPKKQKTLNNKVIPKEIYPSAEKAMTQATADVELGKAISTISQINYFDSEGKKRVLGQSNIRKVIDDLRNRKKLLWDPQEEFNNHYKKAKEKTHDYRVIKKTELHNLNLRKEKIITQTNNNEEYDSNQETTRYIGEQMPLSIATIQALNHENHQIGSWNSHFQLQSPLLIPIDDINMKLNPNQVIITKSNVDTGKHWEDEINITSAARKELETCDFQEVLNDVVNWENESVNNNQQYETENEFTKKQELSDEKIVSDWIKEVNENPPEIYDEAWIVIPSANKLG